MLKQLMLEVNNVINTQNVVAMYAEELEKRKKFLLRLMKKAKVNRVTTAKGTALRFEQITYGYSVDLLEKRLPPEDQAYLIKKVPCVGELRVIIDNKNNPLFAKVRSCLNQKKTDQQLKVTARPAKNKR